MTRLAIVRGSVSSLRSALSEMVRVRSSCAGCLGVDVTATDEQLMLVEEYADDDAVLEALEDWSGHPAAERLRKRTSLVSLEVLGPCDDRVALAVASRGGTTLTRIEGFSRTPVVAATPAEPPTAPAP